MAQCQDNLTTWDIRSWCRWPGLSTVWNYNVTMSVHCVTSQYLSWYDLTCRSGTKLLQPTSHIWHLCLPTHYTHHYIAVPSWGLGIADCTNWVAFLSLHSYVLYMHYCQYAVVLSTFISLIIVSILKLCWHMYLSWFFSMMSGGRRREPHKRCCTFRLQS